MFKTIIFVCSACVLLKLALDWQVILQTVEG
ncbi:hypothetical protein M2403_003328 [Rahnella sp. BIGb0603]|nr:hypothetical protein [Rahnella sp. BIGb0603]